jgi:holliday junction DNA helicase RuvB
MIDANATVGRSKMAEDDIDRALRPLSFDDFIGQDLIKENLSISIQAATRRGGVLDHVVFSGPPGLGKTTLSHIIANEMNANIECVSGPILEKTGDLAGILLKLEDKDILFIDEIHRMRIDVEECLYSAMEDRKIDILLGQGTNAKTMTIDLKPFTLVGATTREDLLSKPFRDRFFINETLEPYSVEESTRIAERTAGKLKITLTIGAAKKVAVASRGIPRKVNKFMRRLRDVAEIKGDGRITEDIATRGLERLGVDQFGLERDERKILEALSTRRRGIGLKSLAKTLNMGEKSIEEVYEPYLLTKGYLAIDKNGRHITSKGLDVIRAVRQGKLL